MILLLGLCACGQKETAPTWQEQYDLGIRYLSEGNYEEAIIAFTAAIEIDPKRPEGYLSLAEAYTGAGDADGAKNVLENGFAATGSEDIRALLEELAGPAENDSGQYTLHVAQDSILGTLELSDVAWSYSEDNDIVRFNEGAVGGLEVRFTVHGPEGLCAVWIATWWDIDEVPDIDIIQEQIGEMTARWKETGSTDQLMHIPAAQLPVQMWQSRPVDAEELGAQQLVLLIGLDPQGETVGYAIVPVSIPGE